jgi:hypothetical protein
MQPREKLLQSRNHKKIAEPSNATVNVGFAVGRDEHIGDALHPSGIGRPHLPHKLPRAAEEVEAINIYWNVAVRDEEAVIVGGVIDRPIIRSQFRQRNRLAAFKRVQGPVLVSILPQHVLAIGGEHSDTGDAGRRDRVGRVAFERLHVHAKLIGEDDDLFSVGQKPGDWIPQIARLDVARFPSAGGQQQHRSTLRVRCRQHPLAVVRNGEGIVVAEPDRR